MGACPHIFSVKGKIVKIEKKLKGKKRDKWKKVI
jgi:hypothetical protein